MTADEHTELVAVARAIATIAHRGQTDKSGVAYIGHPERVAARVAQPSQIAAAWLHDVIEDCGISAQDLIDAGIPDDVVDAVVLLTRTDAQPSAEYYAGIRLNSVALAVKYADIADNTDESRLHKLAPETQERLRAKYRAALLALGADQSS